MSKLTTVKNVVTSRVGRKVLLGQKHAPHILFVAGTIGVVTSTVLACRSTLNLEAVLEENQRKRGEAHDLRELSRLDNTSNYSEKDYKKDVSVLTVRAARDVAKLYGPAVVIGAASICALGGSHVILTKRNGALMAAYAALDKGFGEYRGRVLELVGEDKERELRHGYEEREVAVDGKNGTEVKVLRTVGGTTNSPYARFFDQLCPSWSPQPEYNQLFLRSQQNYANDMLRARGHVFLNEVYDMLGIPRSKQGAVVGWVLNNQHGDHYVDFGIFDKNSQSSIDFVNGREGAILLDFNVDGIVLDLI